MRKSCLAVLFLAGAAALCPRPAYADGSYVPDPGIQLSSRRLARELHYAPPPVRPTAVYRRAQGSGIAAAERETVWVGFSATNHTAQNYWNIYAGEDYGGMGGASKSVWDFENLGNAHGDSLMGWWPTNDRAPVLGSSLTDDHVYAYSCLDFGNETGNIVPGASGRTWGVVGAWHSDPGRNAGLGVTWTPISGGRSAWCGLREHGDLAVVDAVTGHPYNQDCADFIVQNCGPSVKNFPGYVRAWDQMLYRDLTPVEGQALSLSFLYRTWMSTEFNAGAGRRGWFHGDPLSTGAGNFISSFRQNGPIDSFQVYVGVPVNDAAVTLSNGSVVPVFDPQRRWFSEVLRIFDGPSAPCFEVLSTAGRNPASPDTTGFMSFTAEIPWPAVAAIVHSPLNTTGALRLVFRVKTNDTGDDLTRSTWGELGGRGAAQVDDVTIRWGEGAPLVIGDFEGAEGTAGNVNNAIGASALLYWKATSKPPALYFHARPLAGLAWHDLCGPVGAPSLTCDMAGNVLDAGLHPDETIGDPSYEAGKAGDYGILSPTIDLRTPGSGPNPMGITAAMLATTDDYCVQFDVYTGAFNYSNSGCFYHYGCASYPNLSAGTGTLQWGDIVTSPSIYFDPDPHCYTECLPLRSRDMIHTSAGSGVPDSIRIWIGVYSFAPRFGGLGSNPTDGAYFDNISFGLAGRTGGTGDVGTITSDIWQWFNDAFPVASGVPLGVGTTVAALDSCGALVKGALNVAQVSANAGLGGNRLDVLADSIVVCAPDFGRDAADSNSTHVRVDMVFRVLPGPGNYRTQAGLDSFPRYPLKPGMHLLRRPDDRVTVVDPSDGADHSFWAEYLRDPGEFSAGTHNGHTSWDHLTWNSARCDTTETNVFPAGGVTAAFPVREGLWQSTIHESDPKYSLLGISRPRCFVLDTARATDLTSENVLCGSAPAWLTGAPRSRTGWDGAFTTIEGTKIIPDGLLTPGSHVQYFFRKSQEFGHGGYELDPDTSTIFPQMSETNFDGHRWQDFSVLPDRWKDPQFGGAGMACMLYVDDDDRRGDELAWVSVMDSIGGTRSTKWGAHNGWHASSGVSLDADANPNLQAEAFVYQNAQPGTLWDMYTVRASESGGTVGGRLGGRLGIPGSDRLLGHDANVAPTPDMLKQFYTSIALLTGDLNSNDLGPAMDMPEDDIAILSDFLTSGAGLVAKPRGLFAAGNGFAESEAVDPTHASFLATQLGLSLINGSYAALASNTRGCTDLTSTAVISSTDIYGVGLSCFYTDDVIRFNPAKPGAQDLSFYENTGAGPFAAAVYHAKDANHDPENFVSVVQGFDFADVWSRYCLSRSGRPSYDYRLMTSVFSQVCAGWVQPCGGIFCWGDVPGVGSGNALVDYLKIGNSLVRSGNATVHFGVASTGRVRVRLYDVSGRAVRTLADRAFSAGRDYSAIWDGRDDAGNPVARGVYFARIDYASGVAINGRVVFLR